MFAARPIRDFALGAFYLVSGVYSLGFSTFIDSTARSVSGNPAIVVTTDALFPYEVLAFSVFGVVFLAAAGYEFRKLLGKPGRVELPVGRARNR